MPIAKKLLAKLARIYRRLKRSSTTTIPDDKKQVKLCHKGCNTIHNEMELAELGIPSFKRVQELDENVSNTLRTRNRTRIISKSAQVPRAAIPLKMKNNRMAAGKESNAQTLRNSDSELDESPILEAGISRMAFCRKLDSLLQRGLGKECYN